MKFKTIINDLKNLSKKEVSPKLLIPATAITIFLTTIITFSVNPYGNEKIFSETLTCNKEEAQKILNNLPHPPVYSWNPVVVSVNPIKVGNQTLCELIYENKPQENNQENKVPIPRGIIYYGDKFAFLGQILVEKDGEFFNLTMDRSIEINKEYLNYRQKALEEQNKKTISPNEFNNLKTMSNVKLPATNAKAEIIAFVDPYCPHCTRMKEILLEMNKNKILEVHFIFTPISPAGEIVSASVLCDKKTDKEKLEAFTRKYQNKKPCDKGISIVRKNIETFTNLGGKGVPLMILKKGNQIKLIEGEIPKETLESLIN